MKQGEHVALIGTTGSGKTFLGKRFLSNRKYAGKWVIVIDTKHELQWDGFSIQRSVLNASSRRWQRVLFRPESLLQIDQLLTEIYQQGGWTVYIDEVYGLTSRGSLQSFPTSYNRLLTRGRSRGITVWSGMQRPRHAPLWAFTESTHFFIFRLKDAHDRKRVSEFTDSRLYEKLSDLERYEFIYHHAIENMTIHSLPLSKE